MITRRSRMVGLAIVAAASTPAWVTHSKRRHPAARHRQQSRNSRRHRQRDQRRREEARGQLQHRHGQRRGDPQRESEEHGGPAEDLAGHVAGVDRRSDRREHRDRRLSRRRRCAVLHDAADGLAAVRHADAVVLRDHQHLPARRHGPLGGDPARRPVGGVRRRPDGRHRQLPAEDGHGDADREPGPDLRRRESACASTASTVSRSARAGTAASAASSASPTACAIRSSRRTKAASSPRRSSTRPTRAIWSCMRATSTTRTSSSRRFR